VLFTRFGLYKGMEGEKCLMVTAAIDSVFSLLQTLCTLCVFCIKICQHLSSAGGGMCCETYTVMASPWYV